MTREDVYNYIDKYKNAALIEQRNNGIPVSITLAQGLLESAAGTSRLAREGNNHFGVKCHRSYRGDSTHIGTTCYRKYRTVHDSYLDHSKFLKGKRYQELFSLDITDYRGWAHGLKRCGYATDPLYAEKLISMIETYGLDKCVGETPVLEEEEKPATRTKRTRPLLRHPTKRRHDLNYIMAVLGDTYQDIADEYNMKLDKLLDYNDLPKGSKQPQVGDIIYVTRKHSEAHGVHEQYRVTDDGMSLWYVSQMFGIRLKDLAKINNLSPEAVLHKGDLIRLKKD
ncbi:MAG: glucosaminidase domain-containing protein [Muribaculaceae bacterium]|nr:glucosaminidase domain-containing protein [Muribaculaceae bacterium]